MKKLILAMSIMAAVLFPSTAMADKADCGKHLEKSYTKLYNKVARRTVVHVHQVGTFGRMV